MCAKGSSGIRSRIDGDASSARAHDERNAAITDWDPQEPMVLEDQARAYDEMRVRCPVAHSDALGWSLFRHGDVTAATADPMTYTSATKRLAIPNGMDPPAHTVYRDALEPFFRPDRLALFEPRSRQIARDLLDHASRRPTVEAIGDFVDPFAHQVLCAFMGWPVQDWNRISGWTHGNMEATFRHDRAAGARLAREFADYLTKGLDAHRVDSSSRDIMGDLVRTSVAGETLTNDQIVGLLRTWTAGHGTVSAALGIVLRYLATNPELQAQLQAQPDLLEAALWEILRSDGPLVSNNRTTSRAVEIDGREIPAGQRISLMWIAANRDPAVFEHPDRVLLDRGQAGNVLFGSGIHRCLGEALAMLNLRVGVAEVLRGFTRFELLGSEAPVRHPYPSNGWVSLPLRLHPL